MTFDQGLQVVSVIGGVIGAATSARWGHKQVLQRLSSYVTVTEYRDKTSALHLENNDLKIRVAVLEDRAGIKK